MAIPIKDTHGMRTPDLTNKVIPVVTSFGWKSPKIEDLGNTRILILAKKYIIETHLLVYVPFDGYIKNYY